MYHKLIRNRRVALNKKLRTYAVLCAILLGVLALLAVIQSFAAENSYISRAKLSDAFETSQTNNNGQELIKHQLSAPNNAGSQHKAVLSALKMHNALRFTQAKHDDKAAVQNIHLEADTIAQAKVDAQNKDLEQRVAQWESDFLANIYIKAQ